MTDNDLFGLVRRVILAGLVARGLNGWDVARSFEPEQSGQNTAPTVYLFKIGDRRHGSPSQSDKWDETPGIMRRIITQQMETTMQAAVRMDERTDEFALTPSDALLMVADIIQTDEGLAAMRAAGVGILRIADVRNSYNVNDRNQFAADPSFDFVLTYCRTRDATSPHAVSVERSVNRV